MKRINVIGTSGSGKSTLSKSLANKLDAKYIELDALFWGPNWSETPDPILFQKLSKSLDTESWVLDGNYTRTTPIKWKDVDTVIWIDLPFLVTVYQALGRALNRAWTQKELWPGTGNKESFSKLFLSKDSIVLWTIKTHFKHRRHNKAILQNPAFSQINFIRLGSRKEIDRYLSSI